MACFGYGPTRLCVSSWAPCIWSIMFGPTNYLKVEPCVNFEGKSFHTLHPPQQDRLLRLVTLHRKKYPEWGLHGRPVEGAMLCMV